MDFFPILQNPGEEEVIGEDDWSIMRASGVAGKKCRDWEGGLAGILCVKHLILQTAVS